MPILPHLRTPAGWAVLAGLAMALAAPGCGRDESGNGGDGGDETTAQARARSQRTPLNTATITVPTDVRWINSGITMEPGRIVELEGRTASGNAPVGSPRPNARAPLPVYGGDGLIGRIGPDGFPFPINGSYSVQGNTVNAGQALFLGRNTTPPEPFLNEITGAADGVTAVEDFTASREVVIEYEPEPYEVQAVVRATDAPALLTPVDGFYDSEQNPIFDWDEIDNASQYTLEISDFPDFRRIIFSVNVATTSINTASISVDPNNPTAPVTPNLGEGLYYWRVRAQVNSGRLLNPALTWTDRSAPFRLGVELGDQTGAELPDPELLTPAGSLVVNPQSVLPFEVLAPFDASGLMYRYLFFSGACGDVIDPTDTEAELASPWLVFQQTYQTNQIDEPRQRYASFVSPVLSEGEWLLRVETRDGADTAGTRIGVLSYDFTAGCQ